MFVRNEDFRSFIRYYPIISILIGIHILLFVLVNLFGMFSILRLGVGYNRAIELGEYWRLITPIFLHGGFAHVLFNSFSLYLFGPALEQMLGKAKFLIGYFGAGIIANIATFYLQDSNFSHVGASGAIFGLFGIYFYMAFYRKELIDQANSQLILMILGIGLVMTFISPNINILGHLFGFIGGAALAPILLIGAKPFINRGIVRVRRTADSGEIRFKPNRWQRRKIRTGPSGGGKIIWGIFIGLVILGFIARYL
ncbi:MULTISPECIES: rhomboid family intramembrane serine protease [Bacillales]|jgi:rhomboid protease GluP|uniref:rhomboid family intramembrane serine protease n=1 Tax=Bacillales TaxID=1385 RepID=UPI000BF86AA4|nr:MULTISPECIES: rhomboid family intramembrane serine protease [Bacillaceae]MCA0993565.1 rhomboid family intramembrane serine protease [Pseudalkalibacillus hwajinpoensis]PFG02769.1 membrane associated rhomboid family serine protease [Bacillus sp. es.036]QHA90216.1 rhomboid family intramembrane serine protease [Bacillus sp. N1-1]